MSEVARHLLIRGKVQGVGFRWWTASKARDLDLAGWVRNRIDGSVEAVVRGRAEAIGEMISACHRGPPSARVDAVEVREAASHEAGKGGFEQRETA